MAKNSNNRTVIIISGRDRKTVGNAVDGFVEGAVMKYTGIPEDKIGEMKGNPSEKTEKMKHLSRQMSHRTERLILQL